MKRVGIFVKKNDKYLSYFDYFLLRFKNCQTKSKFKLTKEKYES